MREEEGSLNSTFETTPLRRLVKLVVWAVLLAVFALGGLQGLLQAIKSDSRVTSVAVWGTSDRMLSFWGAAYSSQAEIDALADLPEGDLILLVTPTVDVASTLAYFHAAYFGAPRRSVILTCDNPDRAALFFTPIPDGAVRIAAVAFYAVEPPPQFPAGRRAGAKLVVVPYSKLIAEVSDWKYFCH